MRSESIKHMAFVFICLVLLIAGQNQAWAVAPPSVVKEEGVIVENERCPAMRESIQKHKEIIHKMQEDLASWEKELENLEKEVKQMDCASK